jgi:transcriptional regulator with XRE-family HTH domain
MNLETSIETTAAELRAARSQLNWTIRRLSTESGIHRSTIARIEAGKPVWPEIVNGLQRALESAGAVFAVRSSQSRSALMVAPYHDVR